MDRRLFLASTFATAVNLITPKSDEKELVLDYLSKDPNLFRGVVSTGELKRSTCVCEDGHDPKRVMVLDAKRAWILPDGRMEVERYAVKEDAVQKEKSITIECYRDLDGEILTHTTILSEWTYRKLDQMGNTVKERHSERT